MSSWLPVSLARRAARTVPGRGSTPPRAAVCGAADVLTALGVRVEVLDPAVPWPRTGRGHLVVSNHASWLGELAARRRPDDHAERQNYEKPTPR